MMVPLCPVRVCTTSFDLISKSHILIVLSAEPENMNIWSNIFSVSRHLIYPLCCPTMWENLLISYYLFYVNFWRWIILYLFVEFFRSKLDDRTIIKSTCQSLQLVIEFATCNFRFFSPSQRFSRGQSRLHLPLAGQPELISFNELHML